MSEEIKNENVGSERIYENNKAERKRSALLCGEDKMKKMNTIACRYYVTQNMLRKPVEKCFGIVKCINRS